MPVKATSQRGKKPSATRRENHYDLKIVLAVIGSLIGSFILGHKIGSNSAVAKYDKEKIDLRVENDSLQNEINRKSLAIRNDSTEQENWLKLNTTNISINDSSDDLPTLTVANRALGLCVSGEGSGCWKKETTAKYGDTVALSIYYHNTGDVAINNLSVAFKNEYSANNRAIISYGSIIAGNEVIRVGTVSIYVPLDCNLTFIPGSIGWFPKQSNHETVINDSELLKAPYRINIGSVDTGWTSQGGVRIRYRVGR